MIQYIDWGLILVGVISGIEVARNLWDAHDRARRAEKAIRRILEG